MSFANINLGTSAGDHSGDPLRVAFDKINRNFYQITTGANGVTVISSVDSVAGRTGNVTLTVADVPGAVTAGQVTAIVLSNLDGYANLDYVNTRVPNVSTINDTIGTAIDAEDLPGIRTSIGNLQTQITANDNDILSLQTADTTLTSKITGANAAIVTANTAMKAYVDSKDSTLTSAVAAAWATANSAISGSSLDDVIADIVAINANVAGANIDIYWLSNTINNGLLPSVTNLWANLEAANAEIISSNIEMRNYVDDVTAAWSANALAQLNQIVGANAAIITANTAMKSYVDVKVGEIADAWLANAVTQTNQISDVNAAIVTANTALKNYTDNQITTANTALKNYVDAQDSVISLAWAANAGAQASQIAGANAAIVTANAAMKLYVDNVTTGWTANAASQQAQLDALTSNSAAQQSTLNQHTTNIVDLTDATVALAGAITQINTGSGFATVPQLTANVSAINANIATVVANVAVHTANINSITGNLRTISEGLVVIAENLDSLRANALTQHTQIFNANLFNSSQTIGLNNQMTANIIAANAAIAGLTSNFNDLNSDVTNLETTVTGLLIGGIYAYSNSNVASYLPVDSTITTIQSNVAAANAAIISSNTALKEYVDSQVSANAYSNVKVATYLLTSTGNINGDYVNADTRITATALYAGDTVVAGRANNVNSVTPVVALGSVSGSVTIDTSLGDCQTLATNGPIVIDAFSNWPESGVKGSVTLQVLIASTAHTITFPSTVSGLAGAVGYFAPTLTWAAPVTGTYVFTFSTVDAGTNIIATENNSILRTFNSTAESITNTGNSIISLGTTLSTYRTASNGTAFLGNGVSGQIKVISSTVSDTWVVTAASASWPSARVTFANPGQTATLAWNSSAGQWVVLSVFGPPSLS